MSRRVSGGGGVCMSAWVHESARISVIASVRNNGSLIQTPGSRLQWRGVHNSEVSVGRESTVYDKPHAQTEN